eukprot:1244255-Alexandrium_andersonii.AAC.1
MERVLATCVVPPALYVTIEAFRHPACTALWPCAWTSGILGALPCYACLLGTHIGIQQSGAARHGPS